MSVMKITWVLRTLLFSFLQFSSIIIFSTLGLVLYFFSDKIKYIYITWWISFVMFLLKFVSGVKYQLHGQENIQEGESGLILARHESTWETFAFQQIFPRQAFVLKKELLKIPLFGWGLQMSSPIAIDRRAGRKALKQVLEQGVSKLEENIWVVIFPEGTRMPSNKIGKINSGGALLAQKSKANTYLVTHNAGRCWAAKKWLIKPGVVDVYISPPLDLDNLTTKEINNLTEEWFKSHLDPATD